MKNKRFKEMPRESASDGHKKVFSLMKTLYPYHKIYQEYHYSKILQTQYKKLNVAELFQNSYYLKYGNKIFADIYDATTSVIVEVHGKQHYEIVQWSKDESIDAAQERFERQKSIDNLKRNIANEAKVILVELPYWEVDKINEEALYTLILNKIRKGY